MQTNANQPASGTASPFQPGTMVVVTLSNPREKLWGTILALSSEGLSLRGIELASFEDQRFSAKTGLDPATMLVAHSAGVQEHA